MPVKNHLPSILLLLATILSSVAIGLPLWSRNFGKHTRQGLWSTCSKEPINPNNTICCSDFNKEPKAILVSQMLSIMGVVFAAISALLCIRGDKNYSALFALMSLLCMITPLVVYPAVSLDDINAGCVYENDMNMNYDNCSNLDVSYGLQASATALTLLGFILVLKMK